MLSLLSVILGPLFSSVSSVFNKFFDLEAVKVKTEAQVTVSETQATTQIIHDTADDIGLRILRDLLLVGPVIWAALISWDTIVATHWPNLMWHVANFPATVAYLPYAAFTFLLGNIGINTWRRIRG